MKFIFSATGIVSFEGKGASKEYREEWERALVGRRARGGWGMGAQSSMKMVRERTDDGRRDSRLGCSQGLGDVRLGRINCPQISKWSFFPFTSFVYYKSNICLFQTILIITEVNNLPPSSCSPEITAASILPEFFLCVTHNILNKNQILILLKLAFSTILY